MTQFSDFGLKAPLEKALAAEGYVTPTPIQTKAIPPALEGRDILGIAQTGTGKTAAFALPILHRLSGNATRREPKSVRALILSPTRELASQIAESFRAYGKFMDMKVGTVFGGVPIPRQERMMAPGLDILVATPGRLLDLAMRHALKLGNIEVLVLDEADQMFDLGFIRDLKKIVNLLPKKRQTLFFSATMPQSIAELASQYITNPVEVQVAPVATTAERVEQKVIFVPQLRKQGVLNAILRDPAINRALVFTRTKHGADRVVRHLAAADVDAAAIHGNKSQNARERALAAFRTGACKVLVATDIAARGIDVDGVSHVVNFELPNVPESYVHRIGRTARAGREGLAISFCAEDERSYLRDIERLTRQKVAVMQAPEPFEGKSPLPPRERAEPGEAPAHGHHRPNGQHHRDGKRHGGGQHRSGGQARSGGEHRAAGEGRAHGEHRAGGPARDAKPGNGGKRRFFSRGKPGGGKPQQGGQRKREV